jgi:hypothetical protein
MADFVGRKNKHLQEPKILPVVKAVIGPDGGFSGSQNP